MIHFGTHGGLEYTPRKQVALSSNDWPDKLVGTIPHFYIYTIGNVGEALIAKRRTYAGIQSHLTAPFLESNLRGTYKALSNAIELYNKAPNNAASLAVKKLAVAMGIHRDLGLDSTLTKPWNETDIAKVEEFGEEIANEKIVGQLYTLGIPYENARIESSVYAMTIDPIAYGMLRLDKQLKRAKADTEKHKALFTTLYMNPARTLVARLIKSNTSVTDTFICQTDYLGPAIGLGFPYSDQIVPFHALQHITDSGPGNADFFCQHRRGYAMRSLLMQDDQGAEFSLG
jgi:cobaltochelatase CobN